MPSSAMNDLNNNPFLRFHKLTKQSNDPVISCRPSGLNAIAWIGSLCANNVLITSPLFASHTFTLPSNDPVAKIAASSLGSHSTTYTCCSCPTRVWRGLSITSVSWTYDSDSNSSPVNSFSSTSTSAFPYLLKMLLGSSHTFAVPSSDPDAKYSPVKCHDMQFTSLLCPTS
ncbi:hypothetical protein AYI68_g2090 [Smittium mucronatum]|uniref:Uncharacterized protein n=1 Tax=Smittium mucronatum TaxID=133383 RepID=A0A1R0H3N8_9FUNG|nr:hypothetical protein AYI68_g2090 [Smittium mucronatum]